MGRPAAVEKTNECSMMVPPWSVDGKQVFVIRLDIEQMFVVPYLHGEQMFGRCEVGAVRSARMAASW